MRQELLLVAVVLVSLVALGTPAAGQETATLTVTVVSGSDTPIGGATIEATWEGGETTATTAGNGKAFVDVPQGADVNLSVESEDFVRNTPKLVEDASSRDVTVEVARKGEFTLHVTDADGAVENARVSLASDGVTIVQGRTNASGYFTSGTVERGGYVLDAFKSGYHRNITRVTVDASTAADLTMRTGTVNVQFEVLDDHFSPPRTLTDAQVEVGDIGTQRTAGGSVTFSLPVNTRYQISATKEGYRTNETAVYVGTGESTRTLTIQRERALDAEAANERVVVGEQVQVTVRNAYGEAVEGATVLVDGDGGGETDANGVARVAIESEGDHTVVASLDGVRSDGVTVQGVSVGDSSDGEATGTDTPGAGTQVPMPGFTPVTVVLAVLALAGVALLGRFR